MASIVVGPLLTGSRPLTPTEITTLAGNTEWSLGTLCYRNDKGDKYFCTMPRCDITDELGEMFEARILNREEAFQEGVV